MTGTPVRRPGFFFRLYQFSLTDGADTGMIKTAEKYKKAKKKEVNK